MLLGGGIMRYSEGDFDLVFLDVVCIVLSKAKKASSR